MSEFATTRMAMPATSEGSPNMEMPDLAVCLKYLEEEVAHNEELVTMVRHHVCLLAPMLSEKPAVDMGEIKEEGAISALRARISKLSRQNCELKSVLNHFRQLV